MPLHVITVAPWGKVCPVRKKKFKFVLLNNGVICGDRLYKGDDEKKKTQVWPMKGADWMFADTREAGEKSAKKLQTYLDAREAGKAKKK
jgi:hypothetical protein